MSDTSAASRRAEAISKAIHRAIDVLEAEGFPVCGDLMLDLKEVIGHRIPGEPVVPEPIPALEQVWRYMRFRARREQVPHAYERSFYETRWSEGVRNFFGVTVDDNDVLSDERRPSLMAEFLRRGSPEYDY